VQDEFKISRRSSDDDDPHGQRCNVCSSSDIYVKTLAGRSPYNECMKMRGLVEGTDVLVVHYHSGSAKPRKTDDGPLASMS
jgi:hypothetical protein